MPPSGLTRRTRTTTEGRPAVGPFNDKEVTVVAKKRKADAAPAADVQEKAEVTRPARRTVNRLSFQQRTKMVQAMEARRDELLGDRPHLADVAGELSRVLGFPV